MEIISGAAVVPPRSLRVHEVNSLLTYLGIAIVAATESDAVWQIRKIETSGGVTSIKYADGNANYDNVWTDRESLSYS